MTKLASSRFIPRAVGFVASATLLVGLAQGCKKNDDPPPPLPEPKAAAVPSAPLQLVPEDAGMDAGKEDDKPKGVGGHAKPKADLDKCCAALMQNSASAPEPTKTYMQQAAAQCQAFAAAGKDKASVIALLAGALKGANLPAGCQ